MLVPIDVSVEMSKPTLYIDDSLFSVKGENRLLYIFPHKKGTPYYFPGTPCQPRVYSKCWRVRSMPEKPDTLEKQYGVPNFAAILRPATGLECVRIGVTVFYGFSWIAGASRALGGTAGAFFS